METVSNVRSVYSQTVIVVHSVTGKGKDNDPVREIIQYFDLDGKPLATVDSWLEEHRKELSAT